MTRSQHLVTLCFFTLLGFGVIMVTSAAMSVAPATESWFQSRGGRQLCYAILSLPVFWIAYSIDPKFLFQSNTILRSIPLWLFAAACVLCVAAMIPGIGKEVNGARRWIAFGPVQVQPSELIKWSSVLLMSWIVAVRPLDLNSFWKGFVPALTPAGLGCLVVVIEDFGTAALIGVVAFLMMFVGRAKVWHLLAVMPPVIGAAVFFVAGTPYRMARMTAFLDPWADPQGNGFHMIQSLLSFASGGLLGRGLGNGVQKLGYLPEDTTDFIFAVVNEELGIVGAAIVILGFVGIVLAAWRGVVSKSLSNADRMLCFGIGATLGLQAVINIAVATVSMPTKGMSLPLVSAGGSGTLVTAAMIGLLAGTLARRDKPAPAETELNSAEPPALPV